MASIRNHAGHLFFDFRYDGLRCREYSELTDTPANRKIMRKVLQRLIHELATGEFDYAKFFPKSKRVAKFATPGVGAAGPAPLPTSLAAPVAGLSVSGAPSTSPTPSFRDFIARWYQDSLPSWRASHAATVRSTIDCHLLPYFGDRPVGSIQKADLLHFRAEIAQRKGRGGNPTLSAKTINRVLQLLGQALADAADQYGFPNPAQHLKRLKQRRIDIHPFSLAESQQLIAAIRADYRPYLIVRLLTGMRTGEIHGLKWKYVDFEHRQLLIRETWVRGRVEYTKTDGSQREIAMSQPVYDALVEQQARTGDRDYVFCTTSGAPIDNDNFTNRVWYPLLRHLDLEKRRPYQTRHTCATLWLAAGENPEWVAHQLGHVDTTMLFKTYSRFIPNLTRRDGSAFNSLVSGAFALHPPTATQPIPAPAASPMPAVSTAPTAAAPGPAPSPSAATPRIRDVRAANPSQPQGTP